MVRGDSLSAETQQRAPGVPRAVGAPRGLRTPGEGAQAPGDLTTAMSCVLQFRERGGLLVFLAAQVCDFNLLSRQALPPPPSRPLLFPGAIGLQWQKFWVNVFVMKEYGGECRIIAPTLAFSDLFQETFFSHQVRPGISKIFCVYYLRMLVSAIRPKY